MVRCALCIEFRDVPEILIVASTKPVNSTTAQTTKANASSCRALNHSNQIRRARGTSHSGTSEHLIARFLTLSAKEDSLSIAVRRTSVPAARPEEDSFGRRSPSYPSESLRSQPCGGREDEEAEAEDEFDYPNPEKGTVRDSPNSSSRFRGS